MLNAKPEGKANLTPGPSVTTGRSANGNQRMTLGKITMFALTTYRKKKVKKPQSRDKRLTNRETQLNKGEEPSCAA